MLIRQAELDAIRSGDVDLAFRRWDRPRLRVGTRMRTPIGLVEATSVEPVSLDSITDAEARRAGAGSRADLLPLLAGHPERHVFRIGLRYAGPDPRISLREAAQLTSGERAALMDRLDRLDRASRRGAWTRVTLGDHRPPPRYPRRRPRPRIGMRHADVQAGRAQAEGIGPYGVARDRLSALPSGPRSA